MAAFDSRARLLNMLAGKTQAAIYELYLAIPINGNADIRTRLMYDDIRTNLLTAFRSTQQLYAMTAPPVPPLDVCPCGKCDIEQPPASPSGGAGTSE